jgi:pyruvate, water dikinase
MPNSDPFTTGLPSLDDVLHGVVPGDNIVLQVDSIDDYLPFVIPFATAVAKQKRPLIYFRFADHEELLPGNFGAETHALHPEDGFETFISEIFDVIERHGREACYVFDSLSDLAVDWYSDRMLANFFMLTCPYLYTYDTVTYFALLRNHNTALATGAIHDTAQVVLDVYRHKQRLYLQPRKVIGRMSSTMYMLHAWQGDDFRPVTQSTLISEIMALTPQPWLDFAVARQDYWTRTFVYAQAMLDDGNEEPALSQRHSMLQRLLRMAISRDPRVLALAERYLELRDLIVIGKRLVGSGMIGGKSVGMLLARAILRRGDPRWNDLLEPHDSFFIGSDVFYSYLIVNQCWWLRRQLQKSGDRRFAQADVLRERMLHGQFPVEILAQFKEMLEYFGQSPIIVRSSSLLEDAYGNAFSGKYESVFCANQGTPEQRLEEFLLAVRRVYVSTMQEEALAYRAHFGLLERDEQMALLVQRVSGDYHGTLYFPQVAGVGFSFNPFVWNREIDPAAGMMRLVFGLGTRAVDRRDDDYTRIVAMNSPLRRPDSTYGDLRKYSQKQMDVLDLTENALVTRRFEDVAQKAPGIPLDVFASVDEDLERMARERGLTGVFPRLLTFDRLLSEYPFVSDMRQMLSLLQEAYQHPVDIEFSANFLSEDTYRINLLQCRPFQVKGDLHSVRLPNALSPERTLLKTQGPIIGNSVVTRVESLVYVVPSVYGKLTVNDRYAVARLIGRLVQALTADDPEQQTLLLLGPGRWATTTPALGVPVSFAEINRARVVCEIAAMHEGLVPDVSLGTHFFNDLVEMDMLYLAIYPEHPDAVLNHEVLHGLPNCLTSLQPEAEKWQEAVRVIRAGQASPNLVTNMTLNVDALTQQAVLYLGEPEGGGDEH